MSLTDFLDNTFLAALMVIYHPLYAALAEFASSLGGGLVLFSIVLNVALIPAYHQMERAGKSMEATRAAMRAEIARINAHYQGRERYYYVRTVHRQFGHNPLSVLLASADLLLQMLVFATVYRYISGLEMLEGATFFAIEDLSRPDGLLWGINALPILMTALNVASAVFYTASRAKRRTAFAVAGLFLIVLYASPAGLVLYWTSNNAFSLARNYVARKLVWTDPLGRWLTRMANQI